MLVGAQLRRLRIDMELSREEAAEAIRASEWKIHRLENGQVGFKDRDVVDLLRLYGVTDPDEVAGFLEVRSRGERPWLVAALRRPAAPSGSGPMWIWSAATLIRTYEGQLVPGLLQTEDYMQAVIAGAHLHELAEEEAAGRAADGPRQGRCSPGRTRCGER